MMTPKIEAQLARAYARFVLTGDEQYLDADASRLERDGRKQVKLMKYLLREGLIVSFKEGGKDSWSSITCVVSKRSYEQILVRQEPLHVPEFDPRAFPDVPGTGLYSSDMPIEQFVCVADNIGSYVFTAQDKFNKAIEKEMSPAEFEKEVKHSLELFVAAPEWLENRKQKNRKQKKDALAFASVFNNNLGWGLRRLGIISKDQEQDFIYVKQSDELSLPFGKSYSLSSNPESWSVDTAKIIDRLQEDMADLKAKLDAFLLFQASVQQYGGWSKLREDYAKELKLELKKEANKKK